MTKTDFRWTRGPSVVAPSVSDEVAGENVGMATRWRARSGKRQGSMWVLVAALVVASACTSLPDRPSPPIDVEPNQILAIWLQPEPEGPPSPAFRRVPEGGDRPLEQILEFVPQPLPGPIPQSCDQGGNLITALDESREIAYGPCKRPIEIERLWWHIIDVLSDQGCRPNCWPGGESPTGESMPPDVTFGLS